MLNMQLHKNGTRKYVNVHKYLQKDRQKLFISYWQNISLGGLWITVTRTFFHILL